ncbi:MAG: AsmA protein [Hyphomicrobiales bacterium]|nr:AsmA protein [Hyphomicrobiales bacterium]
MPSANGLMRLSLVIAAVSAAGVAVLVGAAALIPPETVRQAVIANIHAVTGLEPVTRGDVKVSLFPSATVSFSDVTLGDERTSPALVADRLTAKLRLLPLLLGRIEAADMSLTRPRLLVAVEPDGRSNWSSLMATLARTLKPAAQQSEHVLSFSEIRMTGGTITITDAARGVTEELSDVELSFAWPSISRSFGATGRFSWRGEAFDASANAADLVAALSGDRSGLKLRLAGAPFKLAFDGSMSQRPSFKMEGTLAADGKSLREALRWASRQPLPGAGFGPFALKAQATLVGGTALLSGVNIELDGNVAEGVLALATEPRVAVKGTLAADALDLTPYISAIEVLRSNERDWSRGRIAVDGLSEFDLDMRLSAGRVTVANVRLGRIGVAANLRDGRLTMAIVEAQAYGGLVKGALILAKGSAGADIKSQLQFAEVDLESCLGELFGIRKLEGKGNLSLSVEASGDSVMALTRTLAGSANLSARQGGIAGFNVEQLLKRLEQRPLSIGGDFRRGRTPFDRLDATAKIAQGTASIEDVRLEGGAIRLTLGGLASIPARELDLKGTATLVSATADATPMFELPFVVQGPWDDPILLPDAQSLIRRSGAAAPLLEAVRDRKTRDTIRTVIDQLDRDGVVPPASRP